MHKIHFSFNLCGFVHESFLYNNDSTKDGLIECKVIGVSLYVGHALTLTIVLKDGSLFSYIPLHAFVTQPTNVKYQLKDLVYSNCKDCEVTFTDFKLGDVLVYQKTLDKWTTGRYILTIDWPDANDMMHLVELSSYYLCLMPNHKIKVGIDSQKNFEPFLKMRNEWIIK